MSKVLRLREDYRDKLKQIKLLTEESEEIREKMQEACVHAACAEIVYTQEGVLFKAKGPKRRCLVCGVTETGSYDDGYKTLAKSTVVRRFTADQFEDFDNLASLDFDIKATYDIDE